MCAGGAVETVIIIVICRQAARRFPWDTGTRDRFLELFHISSRRGRELLDYHYRVSGRICARAPAAVR